MAATGVLTYQADMNVLSCVITNVNIAFTTITDIVTGEVTTTEKVRLTTTNTDGATFFTDVLLTVAQVDELNDNTNTGETTLVFTSDDLEKLFEQDSRLNELSVSGVFSSGALNEAVTDDLKFTLTKYLSIGKISYKSPNEAIACIRANPKLSTSVMTSVKLINNDTGRIISYTLTKDEINAMNKDVGNLFEVTIPATEIGASYSGSFSSGSDSVEKTMPALMMTVPEIPTFLFYSATLTTATLNFKYPTTAEMGYATPDTVNFVYWLLSRGVKKPKMYQQALPLINADGNFVITVPNLVDGTNYLVAYFLENEYGLSSSERTPIIITPSNRPQGIPNFNLIANVPTVVGNTVTVPAVPSSSDHSMSNYRLEFNLLRGSDVVEQKIVYPTVASGTSAGVPYTYTLFTFTNVPTGNYKVTVQAKNDQGPGVTHTSKEFSVYGMNSSVKDLSLTTTFLKDTAPTTLDDVNFLATCKLSWKRNADINNTKVNKFNVYAKVADSADDYTADLLGSVNVYQNDGINDTYTFTVGIQLAGALADKKIQFYVSAECLEVPTNKPIVYLDPIINIQTSISAIPSATFSQIVAQGQTESVVLCEWPVSTVIDPSLPDIVYSITNYNGSIIYAPEITGSNYKLIGLPVGTTNQIYIVARYKGQNRLGMATSALLAVAVADVNTPPALVFPSPSAATLNLATNQIATASSVMLMKENIPSGYTLADLTLIVYNDLGDDIETVQLVAPSQNSSAAITFTLGAPITNRGRYTSKVIARFNNTTPGAVDYFIESITSPPLILDSVLGISSTIPAALTSTQLTFQVVKGFYPGTIEVYLIDGNGVISDKKVDTFLSGNGDSPTKTFTGTGLIGALIILKTETQSFAEVIQ